LFEPSKLTHLFPLNGVASREIIQSSQPAFDLGGRLLVWLQVDCVIGDQVSALAGLRIDHKPKNCTQILLYFVGSLNLIVQSVVTQGSPAGVRNHTKCKKQPGSKDKKELPLQSS
jgi:hypothetical protein